MREMKDSGIEWIGQIPEEWKTSRLKYVVDCRDSERIPVDKNQRNDGPYPYWGAGSIMDYVDAYIFDDDLVLLGEDGAPFFDKHRDVAHHIGGKCWINNHIHVLQAKKCIMINSFLTHFLNIVDYRSYINGTILNKLTQGNMNGINICLPDIYEQEAIAKYLDSKCAEIDALSADIQREIETLEAYKRSVITEAVTKGLDKNVPMKDSGIPWIGEIPEHWFVNRIADLYEDRNERGNDELPLLTVSINSGVSDKELSDDEQDRVFLRSEDRSKYKRVYPGDVTYNMMRAWQGAFGAVRVEGMVSPAYVVAKPTGRAKIDSRYIEALLRSPMGIEEMNRYSYGIMDFRKRLYWPQFRTIKVCLPNIIEQKSIADYIDCKSAEIEAIITQKQEQLAVLADYKKSLIYEYVTGKKEVPTS